MVGQLTLTQHIGVRIPGGQPDSRRELLDFHSNGNSVQSDVAGGGWDRRGVLAFLAGNHVHTARTRGADCSAGGAGCRAVSGHFID